MCDLITITPKANSSRRIKDRVKRHGDQWCLCYADMYDGNMCYLLQKPNTEYLAWFPVDQIDFRRINVAT